MAAYEILLLNTAIPQIQAAQSGDTYLVPRDIAFSAALTLTAGTANGVPYLSSPGKVLTTGSALTFDGTRLTVKGGNANSLWVDNGGQRYTELDFANNGVVKSSIYWDNTNSDLFYSSTGSATYASGASSFHSWYISSERMRLTSTGLKSSIAGTNADPVFSYTSDTNTGIFFPAADKLGFTAGGGSDQMVLTSTGLGIGTSSPATLLDLRTSNGVSAILRLGSSGSVANTTVGTIEFYDADADDAGIKASISNVITGNVGPGGSQGGNLLFSTATSGATPTERARITSGGNFYVGFTSGPTAAGSFYSTGTSVIAAIDGDAASADIMYAGYSDSTTTALGTLRFQVAANGNVTNSNGSYGTISDAKMKTDIVDAGSQWADIKALRFRKFKMKDDPSGLVQLGVVAQEVELTSPGLVDEHADKDAEGNDLGTTTKSVKTSVLLMKAAVALQEAMARIEKLEAEVAALKGA